MLGLYLTAGNFICVCFVSFALDTYVKLYLKMRVQITKNCITKLQNTRMKASKYMLSTDVLL